MIEIDCLGMRCPLPIIRTAEAMQHLPTGKKIHLLADDPATMNDLLAWARMTDHKVEVLTQTAFLIS